MLVFLLAGKSVSLSESERKYEITWLQYHWCKANFGGLQKQDAAHYGTYQKVLFQSKLNKTVRCHVNLEAQET
jgi:hypothetical protein